MIQLLKDTGKGRSDPQCIFVVLAHAAKENQSSDFDGAAFMMKGISSGS